MGVFLTFALVRVLESAFPCADRFHPFLSVMLLNVKTNFPEWEVPATCFVAFKNPKSKNAGEYVSKVSS